MRRQRVTALFCMGLSIFSPTSVRAGADQDRDRTIESKCAGSESALEYPYPFDVKRITQAYRWDTKYRDKSRSGVTVVVVDNGFVGHQLVGGKPQPTKNFPQAFFPADDGFDPSSPVLSVSESSAMDADLGHGTHVTGLVLGGMYGDGAPAANGLDLGAPSVRRLFFSESEGRKSKAEDPDPQDWLMIYIVGLVGKNNDAELDTSKLSELVTTIGNLRDGELSQAHIINLSIGHKESSGSAPRSLIELPTQLSGSLLITSAGNDGQPLLGGLDATYPALSDQKSGNLIVVASHDADLGPSDFSNYEEKRVVLAAPGCRIKSWISGYGDARELVGTSQAAAVVTFAATLLRSQWFKASPSELRERLMVSARYSKTLDGGCKPIDAQGPTTGSRCVRHGNALDIEMALYDDVDAIEFCTNRTEVASGCKDTTTLIGNLTRTPPAFIDCMNKEQHRASVDDGTGLTRSTAIRFKRVDAGVGGEPGRGVLYQMLFRTDSPKSASESLVEKECANIVGDVGFAPAKTQPGLVSAPEGFEAVSVNRLVRLVTRSR